MAKSKSGQPASETKVFTLTRGADKKHSVVYESSDPDAPLRSVYVPRSNWADMPPAIDFAMTPRRS